MPSGSGSAAGWRLPVPDSCRVLHVDAEPGYRGGQRQVRILLVEQQLDPGLHVRALVRSTRLLEELRGAGIDARPWPGALLGALVVAAGEADLLHVHDARSHGVARALGWPRRGRPLVVHRRVDDAPHDRAVTRWKYGGGILVCVSHAVAAVLHRGGVPRERLRVVWSAVDAPPLPPPPRPSGPGLNLVALGALVPHKGHTDLLEALTLCRHPHRLRLVGDGPGRTALLAQRARLGLDERVVFCGDVGEGRGEIAAADAFVHPSRTEGLGTAVLDAMAAGRPVVATRAGGLPEICDEQTGRLAPPADPAALAACLDSLGELAVASPEAFVAMGLVGRARVTERHSPRRLCSGVRAVYDELP